MDFTWISMEWRRPVVLALLSRRAPERDSLVGAWTTRMLVAVLAAPLLASAMERDPTWMMAVLIVNTRNGFVAFSATVV